MKRKQKELTDQLYEVTNIVRDMKTCMLVLDTYTRRVLGRYADIPMDQWVKLHILQESEQQRRIASQSNGSAIKHNGPAISAEQTGATRQRKRAKPTSEPAGSFGDHPKSRGPRDRRL